MLQIYDTSWLIRKPKFPIKHNLGFKPTFISLYYRDLKSDSPDPIELDPSHYEISVDREYIHADLSKIRITKYQQLRIYAQAMPTPQVEEQFESFELVKQVIEDLANSLVSDDPEVRAIAELLINWRDDDEGT